MAVYFDNSGLVGEKVSPVSVVFSVPLTTSGAYRCVDPTCCEEGIIFPSGYLAGFNCGIVGSNLDFASVMLYLGLLPNQSTASTPQGHNQRQNNNFFGSNRLVSLVCFGSTGPKLSTGSPSTLKIRPKVAPPTGTLKGAPSDTRRGWSLCFPTIKQIRKELRESSSTYILFLTPKVRRELSLSPPLHQVTGTTCVDPVSRLVQSVPDGSLTS
ncbi:hypothetical protein FCV25MIE_06772 [Fagus crenata]